MSNKPDLSTPEARDFWKAVFLSVIALPAEGFAEGFAEAVAAADDAVNELIARVKG